MHKLRFRFRERGFKFFRIHRLVYDYINIFEYYEKINLMKFMGFSLSEISEMLPFEMDIMIMMQNKLKSELSQK